MSNGFRQAPDASRKERLRNLEAEIKNMQMALRISQMMSQQMMTSVKNMSTDLGKALALINELQYKLLAVQQVANLDVSLMNTISDSLRLKDFEEASAREDKNSNFTVGVTVNDDSTIILTSKTERSDGGIFRSRIKLLDSGIPELIQGLSGKEVGTKVTVKLNGEDHEIELLGIRQPPPVEAVSQETASPVQEQISSSLEGNA